MATDFCRELAHDDGGTPILYHGAPDDYLLTHVAECDYARPRVVAAPPGPGLRRRRDERDMQDLMAMLQRYFDSFK